MSKRSLRSQSKRQSFAVEFEIDLDLNNGGFLKLNSVDMTQKIRKPSKKKIPLKILLRNMCSSYKASN